MRQTKKGKRTISGKCDLRFKDRVTTTSGLRTGNGRQDFGGGRSKD